jgi:hypothetical protein
MLRGSFYFRTNGPRGRNLFIAARILLDSRKSTGEESVRESLDLLHSYTMYSTHNEVYLDSRKMFWGRIFTRMDSWILAEFLALRTVFCFGLGDLILIFRLMNTFILIFRAAVYLCHFGP